MNVMRVLIVADDPLARAGIASMLTELPELSIVGRIGSLEGLAPAVVTYRPDVLLWDMGWKPETALARLSGASTLPPIVALVDDETDALAVWRAGATGVLPRDAPPTRIAAALSAAAQQLHIVDPAFRSVFFAPAPAQPNPAFAADEAPPAEELTPRELEVLRLVAEGLPNKTIAQRLDISEHTVKFHVNALLGKLEVSSRTEAVVRATRLGLIFL